MRTNGIKAPLRLGALMAALMMILLLAGCSTPAPTAASTGDAKDPSATADQSVAVGQSTAPGASGAGGEEKERYTMVEIKMQDGGVMKLQLDSEAAPITVENFVSLAGDGFYDGLTFHRIYSGFMIQGGDPNGDGSGGPGTTIKGEFADNGWDNPIAHERGVISMARSGDPDSAGSQFFIMHEDAPGLDGQYAAFGKVVEGLDVLDAIAATEVTANPGMRGELSLPLVAPVIESIRVVED